MGRGFKDFSVKRFALIGLLALALVLFAMPSWSWENGRFDSIVDGAIAVAIFVTSALLLASQFFNQEPISMLTVAILITGLLRFYGSANDTENDFIWLHRFCSMGFAIALLLESIPV